MMSPIISKYQKRQFAKKCTFVQLYDAIFEQHGVTPEEEKCIEKTRYNNATIKHDKIDEQQTVLIYS